MSVVAILQARTSSSRLPRKVLLPILGKPMLARQIERVRRAERIDQLVVATSDHADDQPIEDLCRSEGVECFRGSLDDVLDRYYRAALQAKASTVVRLTGDCPLADPSLIDAVIGLHAAGRFHYSSNTDPPTYPDGLDVEVFSFDALATAWREASMISEREHVTPFLRQQPQRFRTGRLKGQRDLSALRWTVDERADFDLVTRIYAALYPANAAFATDDILALIEADGTLSGVNAGFERNEGYAKSLRQDRPAEPRGEESA